MLENFLYLLVLLSALIVGIILSKMCKEEIKNWRKRLGSIVIISIILIAGLSISNFLYKIPLIITFFFIIIVNSMIIWRSYK